MMMMVVVVVVVVLVVLVVVVRVSGSALYPPAREQMTASLPAACETDGTERRQKERQGIKSSGWRLCELTHTARRRKP
ncbi:hypothetical protein E2C01_093373 [Portunus trituberculatus]|uniref:Secreted protein n=1 Tax=Portunus trituberculatus TaxID=210409 RepID=A0A5B7JU97_PORTR|nr:hypothetical protein [Portunus trituberculatus]